MKNEVFERISTAIDEDDLLSINALIASGSFDVTAWSPLPALVMAAFHDRAAIVEQLLRAGARIDDADDDGRTACHAAASRRHAEVMRTLLAHRPNLELRDSNDRTALQLAFATEVQDDVDAHVSLMLVDAGASLDGVSEGHLCRFVEASTAAIDVLMRRGVAVSELRTHGFTALHLAAQRPNNTAVLDMLVNRCGIELDTFTERSGFTCMHCATQAVDAENLRWLIEAGADIEAMQVGVYLSPLYLARSVVSTIVLLAAGAEVCARNGFSAIHGISYSGIPATPDVIHVFIAGGLDLDARDSVFGVERGQTPRELIATMFPDDNPFIYDANAVNKYKRRIAEERLWFVRRVRRRALEVCIGLQSLRLPALQTCEILQCACGPVAAMLQFHDWWNIATTVKHF